MPACSPHSATDPAHSYEIKDEETVRITISADRLRTMPSPSTTPRAVALETVEAAIEKDEGRRRKT
jgi:hypothetical protein